MSAAAEEQVQTAVSGGGRGMYSNYIDTGVRQFDSELSDTRPIPMKDLLPSLLDAVNQLSKYSRATELPAIHRVPHEEIEAMACGKKCPALATYRPGEGVFLDDRLRPESDLFDRSVLLHELVHYLQDLSHEHSDMQPCHRWYYREIEAYAIQKQFLTLVGSQVRVGYSAARSTCDDDPHAASAETR